MHLRISAPSLIWVGLATGHIIVYDVATFIPLMATRRHENPVRAIQTIRTTSKNRVVTICMQNIMVSKNNVQYNNIYYTCIAAYLLSHTNY